MMRLYTLDLYEIRLLHTLQINTSFKAEGMRRLPTGLPPWELPREIFANRPGTVGRNLISKFCRKPGNCFGT